MPHLIVEYSRNLENRIGIRDLVRKVHEAALTSNVFQPGAVRTRAEPRDVYVIADRHEENGFVSVTVRMAQGRDAETRQQMGQLIFETVCDHLAEIYKTTPIGISLEVQEIDPVGAFRKNNLHRFVKERAAKTSLGEREKP